MNKYILIILTIITLTGCQSNQVKCSHGKIPKIRTMIAPRFEPIQGKMNKNTGEIKFTKDEYVIIKTRTFKLRSHIHKLEEIMENYNNFVDKYNSSGENNE